MPTISIGRYSSCLGPIRLSDGSHESSVLWEHTPAATVPYLGLGAEISLVGYVLKTPPVGILDVPYILWYHMLLAARTRKDEKNATTRTRTRSYSSKNITWPQHDQQQFQRPATTFSNFSNVVVRKLLLICHMVVRETTSPSHGSAFLKRLCSWSYGRNSECRKTKK